MMKRLVVPAVLLASLTALVLGAAASSKSTTMRYLVISPHTPEECMKAIDDVNAMGASTLKLYDWGCKVGDHTGYLVISATSEEQALSKVPADLRAKAKAIQITKFTANEVKAMHAQMSAQTGNK